MSEPLAKLEISKEMLEPILKNQIQTAIVQTLGDDAKKAQLIDAIIMTVLEEKVGENGHKSSYSYDNKYTLVEALAKQIIRDVATQAVRDWVESNRQAIKEALERRLIKNKSNIANQMVKTLIDETRGRLNITLDIKGME